MSRKLAITACDRYGEPVPCKAKICRGGTGLNTLRSWLGDTGAVILHNEIGPASGRAALGSVGAHCAGNGTRTFE
jgi:hypothetical protein